jgi:hypothetical protein
MPTWSQNKEEPKKQMSSMSEEENKIAAQDWEDIKNQREYRDKKLPIWRWAGSVYNVLQNAKAEDQISNITLGWVRSYIDTGKSQIMAAQPEFEYEAFGASDRPKENLWRSLTETILNRSYFGSHKNISFTDSLIFGCGVFEVYQDKPYRTIRVPQRDGTFKDKVILDNRAPRVGIRAVSPFRCTRNPNVSDLNEIGSCTKEELLTRNQFIAKYVNCMDSEGKPKYKNLELPDSSHVKVTKYQDELRDVYRIYALAYGNKEDGESETPPEDDLGMMIFDKPLKIHDLKDEKGKIIRSMGLNIPGMCNLIWLPYFDKLTADYSEHDPYGMGLPELMEGMDTFMQTIFNMTVDNFRLGNTVVLGNRTPNSTTVDFDANTYYGGEFVNADITSTTLGQDRTANFSQMYDVVQNLTIPGTGINISQIQGDTSRTAFEFSQRIEANNKRTETVLQNWEEGALKRAGILTLAAGLSELTVHELSELAEGKAEGILKAIKEGKDVMDDYEFEDGKPIGRKQRYYIDVKGLKEDFSGKKTRSYSTESAANTLVPDSGVNKIPVTEEYVYPDYQVESGIAYDVKVNARRNLVNKKIKDAQSFSSVMNVFYQVSQIPEETLSKEEKIKIMEKVMDFADMDYEDIFKEKEDDQISQLQEMIKMAKSQQLPTPQDAMVSQAPPGFDSGQLNFAGQQPEGATNALSLAAQGSL